jgi:hypothetical protein
VPVRSPRASDAASDTVCTGIGVTCTGALPGAERQTWPQACWLRYSSSRWMTRVLVMV